MKTDTEIIDLIILHEGSRFTDDPHDFGGPTKYGITLKVLSQFLGRAASVEELRQLSRERAAQVYRALFVAPFAGLSDPLRINVADFGVHAGQVRAVKLLQQIVGVTVDGILGPATLREANSRSWNTLFVGGRLAYYEAIIERTPSQIKWRNGWRARALSFYDGTWDVQRRGMLASDAPLYGFVGKAQHE